LETHWFPPDYPRNRSTISVPPAIPEAIDPAAFAEARLRIDVAAGFAATEISAPEPLGVGGSLSGSCVTVAGTVAGTTPFVREIAVLGDGRFTYPLIVDSAGSPGERRDARARFHALVRSVAPLP